MKTDVYYYSGTGNSLWTAKRLAEELGDASLLPISRTEGTVTVAGDTAVGLVFPVHIWGVPRRVVRFAEQLQCPSGTYIFAVAVNAGQVSRTLVQLDEMLKKKGLTLSSGFDMVMPSNYIPWGGPGPVESQMKRIRNADEKIRRIAREISQRKTLPLEKGPLWQRVLFSMMYRMSFDKVPSLDKSFFADENCNSCGICAKVCPAANVELKDGKPAWNNRCEQCLACIQWCPKMAIQYGKKTHAYERYHHPDIKLAEIIANAPEKA